MENISPPVSAKLPSTPSQPPQSVAPMSTQAPQGHYYQHGFKFMGVPSRDAPPQGHEKSQQQQLGTKPVMNPQPVVQNPQAMQAAYSQGIPMHGMGIHQQAPGMVAQVQGMPHHGQAMPHGQGMAAHNQTMQMPSLGMPQHGQMPSHDQLQRGNLERSPYSYNVGPPQLQRGAQQWQSQPPQMGQGWMK